jgi:hypothetical protein
MSQQFETFIVAMDPKNKKVLAAVSPTGGFKDMPSIGYDDGEFLKTPHLVIPRLAQLAQWMVKPSKNTNWFLYWSDSVLQILTNIYKSMLIGDGMKPVVMDEKGEEEIPDLSIVCQDWMMAPCGSSPDNRGFTIDNFVIPLILIDCLTCGGSAWYKQFGMEGIHHQEEVGELMVKWLDPRTYATVRHDIYGWFKLMQYRSMQPNLPMNREQFDTQFNPTLMTQFGHLSGSGQVNWAPPINIKSADFYWFNLFLRPPVSSIVQALISKLILSFLRDKFVEKAVIPFLLVKVPRHAIRDASEKKFMEKLDYVGKVISEYRSGDAIGVQGEEYNNDGTIITKGWEVTPIDITKVTMDFNALFRQLNEEIGWGVYMSIATISPSGVQGQTTHMATGGEINANIIQEVKSQRRMLSQVFQWILKDVIEHKTGEVVKPSQVKIEFSKIREEDAALFLNVLNSLKASGALLTNEMRREADRLGVKLKDLPEEMTPEGQMFAEQEAEVNPMNKEADIPDIFMETSEESEDTENNEG